VARQARVGVADLNEAHYSRGGFFRPVSMLYHARKLGAEGGGASLFCFYQSQAENLSATHLPDGRLTKLDPEHLPPADKLVLFGHHLGRSQTIRNVLDAAIVDEADPFNRDPELDVFDSRHGPPFSHEFVARIRAGQAERMERITTWARDRLEELEARLGPGADEAFIVHRRNPLHGPQSSGRDGHRASEAQLELRDGELTKLELTRFSRLRSIEELGETGRGVRSDHDLFECTDACAFPIAHSNDLLHVNVVGREQVELKRIKALAANCQLAFPHSLAPFAMENSRN